MKMAVVLEMGSGVGREERSLVEGNMASRWVVVAKRRSGSWSRASKSRSGCKAFDG